MVASFKENMLL